MQRAKSTLSRRHVLRLASVAGDRRDPGGVQWWDGPAGGQAGQHRREAGHVARPPRRRVARLRRRRSRPRRRPRRKPAAAAATNIRFITWWEPMQHYLADIAKQFESAKGIKVDTEFVPSTDFVPKMEASLVAGTWGDASIIENSVQVKFMDAGLHYDMTDMVKADNIDLLSDWSLMGLEIWEGKVL